jgi:ADP-heptose:LPS heptosyltransferase
MVKPHYVFVQRNATGDEMVLTALVRDIAKAMPEAQITIRAPWRKLWQNNPYVTERDPGIVPGLTYFKALYGSGVARQKYETIHFLPYFHRVFFQSIGKSIPVTAPIPDLHLSETERTVVPINRRYWVINAGGKSDMPIKVWHRHRWQHLVNTLVASGIGVVQIGSCRTGEWHPRMQGALDLVGKTSVRDLMQLVKHSEGVVCGITMAMHMAAALERPCVVLAGGREAWWWEAYVRENRGLPGAETLRMPHRYLHTIGLLDCCRTHGCWRSKTVPLAAEDTSICQYPIFHGANPAPRCLDMITVQHVVDAMNSYYADHSLPPITHRTPPIEYIPEDEQPPANALGDLPEVCTRLEGDKPPINFNDQPIHFVSPPTRYANTPEGKKEMARVATHKPPGAEGCDPVATTLTDPFENPILGGKITVCALLYGDYPEMHQRFFDALLRYLPPLRADLRIASNALGSQTEALVRDLVINGRVSKYYCYRTNRLKYPVMRDMFRDPAHPITTSYTLWLDDDTLCDKDSAWLWKLGELIVEKHPLPERYRLFGPHQVWTMTNTQHELIREAPWYQQRLLLDHRGQPSPQGRRVPFATGSFWAIHTPLITECDIPDARLEHNGGDYFIGAQIQQYGYRVHPFSNQKQIVNWSASPRRGVSTPGLGVRLGNSAPVVH